MKRLLIAGVTFFSLSAGVCSEKIYITPDQVHIGKEGILINVQGNCVPVNGLFHDGQGLHVMAREMVDEHTFSWACPKGHFSPDGSGMCNYSGCQFQKK